MTTVPPSVRGDAGGDAVGDTGSRPWGSFTVLEEQPGHKVKRLEVLPGRRLSSQRHRRRCEHWYVVSGRASIQLDGQPWELGPGGAADIPRGSLHRLANEGLDVLVLIEVQRGDYFGEDDIERFDDDFGRV